MQAPPRHDFASWSAARFQTEEARDRFLDFVKTHGTGGVEVVTMPDDRRGALVRWLPGHFLDLNDIAYSHGGRIIVRLTESCSGYDRTLSSVPARRSSRFLNTHTA